MPLPVFSSPKTSLAAVAIIVTIIGYVLYEFTAGSPANIQWEAVVAGLIAAVGFFFARDNNKTSEAVGLKPVSKPGTN